MAAVLEACKIIWIHILSSKFWCYPFGEGQMCKCQNKVWFSIVWQTSSFFLIRFFSIHLDAKSARKCPLKQHFWDTWTRGQTDLLFLWPAQLSVWVSWVKVTKCKKVILKSLIELSHEWWSSHYSQSPFILLPGLCTCDCASGWIFKSDDIFLFFLLADGH